MALPDGDRNSGFNAPAVILGGMAVVFFVIALSLFIEGGYSAMQAREAQAKIFNAEPSEEIRAHQAEQQALLDEPTRYLDRDAGVVSMPIEDAKKRVVSQYAK